MKRERQPYRIHAPLLLAVTTIGLVGAAIAHRWLSAHGWLVALPVCILNHYTGIACPTCGTTRAFFALSRGHLMDALAYQPLIMLVTLGGFVMAVIDLIVWGVTGQQPWMKVTARVKLSSWSIVGLILANWIYILMTLSPRIHAWLGW